MKSICKELQDVLAAEGPQAVRENEGAQRHLEECAKCFSFLETLSELNENLREMPVVDAPDVLVEKLLARPELNGNAEVDATPARRDRLYSFGRIRWAGVAAAAVVTGVAVAVLLNSLTQSSFKREPAIADLTRPRTQGTRQELRSSPEAMEEESVRESGRRDAEVDAPKRAPTSQTPPPPPAKMRRQNQEPPSAVPAPTTRPSVPNAALESLGEEREVFEDRDADGMADRQGLAGGVAGTVVLPDQELRSYYRGGFENVPSKDSAAESKNEVVTMTSEIGPADSFGKKGRLKSGEGGGQSARGDDVSGLSVAVPREVARAFLAERASIDGLTFKDAKGYWANTYLPGDPAMRFLQARLRQYDRGGLATYTTTPLRLHDAARPTPQPFDSPGNAAVAVYLHADRQGLSEESRFLVQVGLKAIERQAGRRPAMNVGVVLDLRGEIPVDVATSMRALLMALNEAKELGDRFRLVVAGRPGGLVLEPDDFRHGTLAVTWNRFFGQAESAVTDTLSLVGAAAKAIQSVNQDDDPTAVLGSSLVLLVTSQPLGDATGTLSDLAHQSAVAGIPLSVVGVGGNVLPKELERVAGQGNRRLLELGSEAAGLVDQELSAASRVVARALRLRIRLARGVKLVDVLGSERLDEVRAQKVREAEQSIDLRLSRNLGIEADRGEDEEGIQIVIPNFYAGDEHAVVLDVVASGPGPIADVTVRYKDLAFLRNGVARARLALERQQKIAGPLEYNVLKNFLAQRLSEVLEDAGVALARANPGEATRLLTEFHDLLTGLRLELPGLQNGDLARDIAMLEEYTTLLGTRLVEQPGPRNYLSDSLRYAARLKVQPQPPVNTRY
jgi:hypothetical protein